MSLQARKRLIFRADGREDIGLGHLYRLVALYELVKARHECLFVTRSDSTLSVFPDNVPVQLVPDDVKADQEPKWLASIFEPSKSVLIADGYQFDGEYQKAIRVSDFKMVYIDDLTTGFFSSDVVINHAPAVEETDFQSEPHTRLFLGTRFALLRPSFLNAAGEARTIKKVSSVFVSFGGADPSDLTFKAVSAVNSIRSIKRIHVVLGAAYQHQQILELAGASEKLVIHQNLDDQQLLDVMQQCHFGIVPASTILYELCCVKMPVLCGYYVDNQKLIYEGFARSGAINRGGDFENYTTAKFRDELTRIFAQASFDSTMNAQAKLFDSNIRQRHLEIIDSVC